ncbi:AAA family ATPase [Stenotrophomonas sp. JC08]|uniref:AAA family ATPase n=1 Tax=Stenotrophomonas TaxID=40323 RepID=UPI0036D47FB6
MVSPGCWIRDAIDQIQISKVEHKRYVTVRKTIVARLRAILPGELMVLVGPPRVGKSRCICDALSISEDNKPDSKLVMSAVMVDAENSAKNGEFSTKDFMISCLKAIHHPIYGEPAEDDLWGFKLDQLLHKTSEATLRQAFERALELRQTEYLIIDEAHHVKYVPGGDAAAARVLDSWKCLANKTKVKLVLSGSYKLLPLLALAPHMVGRQSPLDFGRYRVNPSDVNSWEQVLREFSKLLRFDEKVSLSTWNILLFEGSLGCVGLLSRWLRSCLASMLSEGVNALTLEALLAERLPTVQECKLLDEILLGEAAMKRFHENNQTQLPPQKVNKESKSSHQKNGRPFQRNSRRSPAGGRA